MISASLRTTFLIGVAAWLSQAQPIGTHVFIGKPDQHKYDGVRRLMKELPGRLDIAKLRGIVPGSPEERVLLGGRESIKRLLNLQFETYPTPTAFTQESDEGDTLVARWNATKSGKVEQSVWLLDTPLTTTVVVEVPSAVLAQDAIQGYVENLMRWDRDSGIALRNLAMQYMPPERDEQLVVAIADHQRGSRGAYYLFFFAMSVGPRGYVSVSVPKKVVFNHYAPEDCEVRERFPPLEERIAAKERGDLIRELGKGVFEQQPFLYPRNRDEILLCEIARREPLTSEEMRAFIFADPGRYPQAEELPTYRLRVLMRALTRQGQLQRSRESLASIALAATLPPRYFDLFYGSLCYDMAEQKVEFSAASFAMIKQGKAVDPSLSCLGKAAQNEADLQRLSEVEVPSGFEERKQSVLQSARSRIENARLESERLERLRNPPPPLDPLGRRKPRKF